MTAALQNWEEGEGHLRGCASICPKRKEKQERRSEKRRKKKKKKEKNKQKKEAGSFNPEPKFCPLLHQASSIRYLLHRLYQSGEIPRKLYVSCLH